MTTPAKPAPPDPSPSYQQGQSQPPVQSGNEPPVGYPPPPPGYVMIAAAPAAQKSECPCGLSRKVCFIGWGICAAVTVIFIIIGVVILVVVCAATRDAYKTEEYQREFKPRSKYNETGVIMCHHFREHGNDTIMTCVPGEICETSIEQQSSSSRVTLKKGCAYETKIECKVSDHRKAFAGNPDNGLMKNCYCLTDLCNAADKCTCERPSGASMNRPIFGFGAILILLINPIKFYL